MVTHKVELCEWLHTKLSCVSGCTMLRCVSCYTQCSVVSVVTQCLSAQGVDKCMINVHYYYYNVELCE